MTAEEKLKELYERDGEGDYESRCRRGYKLQVSNYGGVYLSAEHIDLIANLVVERLREGA